MRELPDENNITASWTSEITQPLVSIICTTFNHVRYIEYAISGFLSQITSFPFEIIIHDDASTDGTADIVREYAELYPNIINAIIQQENLYSRNLKRDSYVFPLLNGKYLAHCEGDDYWTDPDKLQKQVDILESDPGCSMCCHRAQILYEDGSTRLTPDFGCLHPFPENRIFYQGGSSVATATMVARKELYINRPEWGKSSPVGDMPLKLWYSENGRIAYLPDVMAVRRLGTPGSWNDRIRGTEKEKDYYVRMVHMLNEYMAHTSKRKMDVLLKTFDYEWELRKKFGIKNSWLKPM